MKSIASLFSSRGLLFQKTSQALSQSSPFLAGRAVYCGYDPTAASLHLGNFVSLMALARLQSYGMKPILLVGGATAMIGDPSGKSTDRPFSESNVVQQNSKSIVNQLTTVYSRLRQQISSNKANYELETPSQNWQIINNADFYCQMNSIDFLRDVGRHFRVNYLLNKETIASRVNSSTGISFTEFSYNLLQAYDYLRLYDDYGCSLQIGGSDQWGNITSGCQLIRRLRGQEAFGLTMPLLTNKSGMKFGKSEGNALFLNSQMTPPSTIYQYLLNSADDEVDGLLKALTFYSQSYIERDIMTPHLRNPALRLAQRTLAEAVCRVLQSDFEEDPASQFYKLGVEMTVKFKEVQTIFNKLLKNPKTLTLASLSLSQLSQSKNIIDLIIAVKFASSRNQVRRDIAAGGLYLNNVRLTVEDASAPLEDLIKERWIDSKYAVLRWGKKKTKCIMISEL